MTPLIVSSGGIEPYVDSMELHDGHYLPTSPEISLKKIFAMQDKSCRGIYEIAHAFRNDITGKHHLREFTMIEWYRKNCDYLELVNDVVDLMAKLGDIVFPGKTPPDIRDYEIVSVADLFERVLQVRPEPGWGFPEYHNLALSKKLVNDQSEHELKISGVEKAHLLSEVFTLLYDHAVIEFGKNYKGLFFIKDYPHFLRGMAKLSSEGWAMRLEAYLNNLELCSGYQELDNADELRQVWEHNNSIRVFMGKKIHPVDLDLLHISESMRGVSGMALGLERVLMSLYEIPDIGEFKL